MSGYLNLNNLPWPGMGQNYGAMAGYTVGQDPTVPTATPPAAVASPLTVPTPSGATPGATPTPTPTGGATGGATPGSVAATGIGWNLGTAQLGMGGLQALAGLYTAWQASDLAKKTFSFNRDMANINLNNQMRSYNTALSDRARSREVAEGGQAGFNAQSYVDQNRMVR